MSILYDPATLSYAVVEYLKTTNHIFDPVDTIPTLEGQYRVVCLTSDCDEASRISHLLCATSNGRFYYSAILAEADHTPTPNSSSPHIK